MLPRFARSIWLHNLLLSLVLSQRISKAPPTYLPSILKHPSSGRSVRVCTNIPCARCSERIFQKVCPRMCSECGDVSPSDDINGNKRLLPSAQLTLGQNNFDKTKSTPRSTSFVRGTGGLGGRQQTKRTLRRGSKRTPQGVPKTSERGVGTLQEGAPTSLLERQNGPNHFRERSKKKLKRQLDETTKDATANYEQCCRSGGLGTCADIGVCSYNVTASIFHKSHRNGCNLIRHTNQLFSCASGGSDNTNCCISKGVHKLNGKDTRHCLQMCRPSKQASKALAFGDLKCIPGLIEIVDCHRIGALLQLLPKSIDESSGQNQSIGQGNKNIDGGQRQVMRSELSPGRQVSNSRPIDPYLIKNNLPRPVGAKQNTASSQNGRGGLFSFLSGNKLDRTGRRVSHRRRRIWPKLKRSRQGKRRKRPKTIPRQRNPPKPLVLSDATLNAIAIPLRFIFGVL